MTSDPRGPSSEEKLERMKLKEELRLGEIYIERGDWEEAIEFYNKCLSTAEKLNDTPSKSHILHSLGLIHASRGKWDEALEYYNKSVEVSRELDDIQGIAQTYNNIGLVYANTGEWTKAQEYYSKSIDILEKIGNDHGMAQAYINIGSVYYRRGDWDKALEFYEKSLEILKSLGDIHGMAQTYNNLGSVFFARGELDKSIEFYEKSLEILKSLGDIHGMAQTYNNLGSVFFARGELDKSIEFYEKSLEILKSLGDIHGMAQTYGNMGLLLADRGDLDRSEEYYNRSLKMKEELGDKHGMAQTYGNIGILRKIEGDPQKALELLNKAGALFIELEAKDDMWKISRNEFECLLDMGEFELSIDKLSVMFRNSYREELMNSTILILRDFVVKMGKISRWDIISQIGKISPSARDSQIECLLKAISAFGNIKLKKITQHEFENIRSQIQNKNLSSIMNQIVLQEPSDLSHAGDGPLPMKSILMRAEQHISEDSPIAMEFRENIESIHPRTDWREYLDLLIVIGQYYDEYGENPRTSDLANILQFTNDKVRRRADTMEDRYIRINRPTCKGALITIDSQPYWDFDELQEEFNSVLEDLEEFLAQHLQDLSDDSLRTIISALRDEILEQREDSLFGAVTKYKDLIQKLNRSGVQHELRDVQIKTKANRYILTIQGEEVFLAWQRGEFHTSQPSQSEGIS